MHVTADGVLLAFHDDVLDRVTDRTGVIARAAVVRGAAGRVDGREPIPLLEDLLGAWPDLRVNIDPKHDARSSRSPTSSAARGAVDRVCIGAFSDERLDRRAGAAGPGLCTSLGPREIAKLGSAATGGAPAGVSAPCAQVPPPGRRRARRRRGSSRPRTGAASQVHVWTIDDAAEMERLLDLGVDGIMTDRPAC